MPVQPGDVLRDRYEIRRIIKAGGMGSVAEALDRNLEHTCAVKEMLEVMVQSGNSDLIRRKFKEEAQMLVRLQHDGIPRVRDFFNHENVCYVVMDLVEGSNLEQELAERLASTGRPFPPEQVVKDILQILDILVYLHGLDPPVIHRDIKPANLIRERATHRIKLVDFGLARAADSGHSQTIIGTMGYCPLEQLQGHAEPRSDLYALGVTAHQLVTGCTPAILSLEPLEEVAPNLDPQLVEAIHRATAHKAGDRYRDAAAMRSALIRVGRHPAERIQPAPAPLIPDLTGQPESEQKGWTLTQAGLVTFVSCAFLGLGVWMGRPSASPLPPPTTPHAVVAEISSSSSPTVSATPPVARATSTPTPKPAAVHPHPRSTSAPPQVAHHPAPGLPTPSYPTAPHLDLPANSYPTAAQVDPPSHAHHPTAPPPEEPPQEPAQDGGGTALWQGVSFRVPSGFSKPAPSETGNALKTHRGGVSLMLNVNAQSHQVSPDTILSQMMNYQSTIFHWQVSPVGSMFQSPSCCCWTIRQTQTQPQQRWAIKWAMVSPVGTNHTASFQVIYMRQNLAQTAYQTLTSVVQSMQFDGQSVPAGGLPRDPGN